MAPHHWPKRFLADQNGIISIEFALILPILFLLFATIIEGANLYRVHNEMSAAARDGGRKIAVSAKTEAAVIQEIRDRMAAITDAPVSVTVSYEQIGAEDHDVTVDVAIDVVDALLLNVFGGEGGGELEGGGGEGGLDGEAMSLRATTTMLVE